MALWLLIERSAHTSQYGIPNSGATGPRRPIWGVAARLVHTVHQQSRRPIAEPPVPLNTRKTSVFAIARLAPFAGAMVGDSAGAEGAVEVHKARAKDLPLILRGALDAT